MNIPTTNPFKTAENQILTTAEVLTDEVITGLIKEHHGSDAEIVAIGRGGRRGWVRVFCWIEELLDWNECWIWITNDVTEWSLVSS